MVKRHYRALHSHGKRHLRQRPYLIPIAGSILALIVVAIVLLTHGGQNIRPSDLHVVFLFDNGKEQTLDTRAATVGDLVNKLPLHLISEDVIEPGLDTPIVEDNFRVNVYRARPVTVVDQSGKIVTLTAQKSPRVVAQKAGLSVYPEDTINFAQGSLQENIIGEKVVIDRAVPVLFNLYGTPLTLRTHAKTVGQLIKEKKVKINDGDTLQPAATTPITPDLQIFVIKNGIQITTVTEDIAPPTQVVEDSSLSFGTQVTRQPGTPGKKLVTYQVNIQGGVEVGRTAIQSLVVADAVPQIIARGKAVDIPADKTAQMAAAGIGPGDYAYVNYVISHESGWCPTKWQGQVGYCPAYYEALHSIDSSYGYGLGQATPASKMAPFGADWQTSAVTQLKWATSYATKKFGSWGGAYNYWLSHHSW